MINPTMKILYGPPGTGKTWLAAREAVRTIDPESFQKWTNGDLEDRELFKLHQDYAAAGNIKWVTFHPSYSYEDFVEGFRPTISSGTDSVDRARPPNSFDKQSLSFEVQKGPFRDLCDFAEGRKTIFGPPLGAKIPSTGGAKEYEVIAAHDTGWRLLVKPERSDEVDAEQEKFVDRITIERAIDQGLSPQAFSIPGKSKVVPEAYGIEGDREVLGSQLRRMVGKILKVSSSDVANSAHYGAVAKYIIDNEQVKTSDRRVCLVIDEINRADLSRVFGELITLLEPDKRIGASDERRVHLPYSGDKHFGVPASLSVIGTMNTADRSITSMDFAMRRRFVFEEVASDPKYCPSDYGGMDLATTLTGINRRLTVLRGRDFLLGHSVFMEESLETIRSQFVWPDDASGRIRAVAYTIRTRIVPLLLEYFHEDWRKVEVALGLRAKEFGSAKLAFFTTDRLNTEDSNQFEEVFDSDEAIIGQSAEWWNPEDGANFNSEAFTEAIGSMS